MRSYLEVLEKVLEVDDFEVVVVVGVDTLELDVLEDVLLETLVLTLDDEVVVVEVDTLELDQVNELLALERDEVDVELLALEYVE